MTRVCGGMCEEEEIRASNEGYPKVPEDFTITEKASTRAFAQLKVPNFTFIYHGVDIHLA